MIKYHDQTPRELVMILKGCDILGMTLNEMMIGSKHFRVKRRIAIVKHIFNIYPGANITEISIHMGRSRATIYHYLDFAPLQSIDKFIKELDKEMKC
jgi:hypothetical protein